MSTLQEIKKLAIDNITDLSDVDKSYKTLKGALKLNLSKMVYIKLLKKVGIEIMPASNKNLTKKDLYNQCINNGIKVAWIGSTKKSLQELLDNYNVSSKQEINNFFVKQRANDQITIRPNELINYIDKIMYHPKLVLRLSVEQNGATTYRFLTNRDNFYDILNKINAGIDITDISQHGSDMDLIQSAVLYGNMINLTWYPRDNAFTQKRGAFMPYYHTLMHLDLTRYQFYNKTDTIDDEACFIYALRMAGIKSHKLYDIKLMVVENNFNINDIKLIAQNLDITIKLTFYDEKEKHTRTKIYNKGFEVINIGLISGHYFINEQTNITAHAIKYYNMCYNHNAFPSVYIHHNNKNSSTIEHTNYKSPELDSYHVIINIIKANLIEPITLINCNKKITNKMFEYKYLMAPRKHQIKSYSEFKTRFAFGKSNVKTYNVIFADFESFVCPINGYFIPYCLSYSYIDNPEIFNIYGLDCALEFLNNLDDNAIIITHNLSFDFKMMQDHLTDLKQCIQTGTQIKTISAKYNKYRLIFKDNCAFLSGKLSSLPEKFKLDSGDKEAYPYSLINNTNYDSSAISIDECLKHIDSDKHAIFQENCLNFNNNGVIDLKAYTIKYCNQDVRILKQAFVCFREQILSITDNKIDILHSISISQVSDDFFRLKGCYDNCFKFSGVVHDFIRRCIVGGRVMTADNKKYHITEQLQDFDAVSLYPSAMSRMHGYLQGIPKVIYKFMPEIYDYYFVEIIVDHIGIKRKFPLVSIKDDDGVLNFTNDIIGKHIYVDKVSLEDLIAFQDIKYTFVRGYYFDEGFNKTINTVIRDVFDIRNKLKSEGNPLQETYKLIMNSSYGKLCQKAINRKILFKNPNLQSTNNFISNNYQNIVEYTQINDNLIKIIVKKSIVDHFAPVHMACQVLSMSKRIMNEVICLAEDNSLSIYYQDTDSMHISANAIDHLSSLFKQKYDRLLIGKGMGQFHSDFSVKNKLATDIVAIESIFLGKKCYIDKLQYNIGSDIYHDYHIRMKSIPSGSILDEGDPMTTYMRLYDGAKIVFNLAKYCVMECTKNLRMIPREIFNRAIQF